MNLIENQWIPVRRRSGRVEKIAPWEITSGGSEEKVMELAAPRADFNGALIQFLIALVQTTCPPKNRNLHRRGLKAPPSAKTLKKAFQDVLPFFTLDGKGRLFMQDIDLEIKEKEILPISYLLIEAPTEKTIKDNTDHFVKRGELETLCSHCCATALFTLQTNAPSGGKGHRTGLRGGGPLTTLVLGKDLWETVWLNVLEQRKFLAMSGNGSKNEVGEKFPWLLPTRTSEGGKATTPKDVHPAQNYWAMPRRIRLVQKETEDISCTLCRESNGVLYKGYVSKSYGINYKGPWFHPLSPYYIDEKRKPNAVHPQPGGIGYRHWLGTNGGKRHPARIVNAFCDTYNDELHRLWAFGYDMDNMKARCWYESEVPLILVEEAHRESYQYYTEKMIEAARSVATETKARIKEALFKPVRKVKKEFTASIEHRFWQETEKTFFSLAAKLRDDFKEEKGAISVMKEWYKNIRRKAEELFEESTLTAQFEEDPERVSRAWNRLQKALGNKNLRQMLGLPERKTEEAVKK